MPLTVGEVVTRSRLSTVVLGRVEYVLSLLDFIRSSTVLNTPKNHRLYELIVTLNPLRQPVVPPADLISGKSDLISPNLLVEEKKVVEGFLDMMFSL